MCIKLLVLALYALLFKTGCEEMGAAVFLGGGGGGSKRASASWIAADVDAGAKDGCNGDLEGLVARLYALALPGEARPTAGKSGTTCDRRCVRDLRSGSESFWARNLNLAG